jgi:FeS assembly SUF system regulator
MGKMLRIGKLTDYATVILANLASDRARLQNASTLAGRTHIAAPTVSKLLKQLQRAGLVNSTRGTHGGYQLARSPDDISAAAILDALEGPIALTDCSVGIGHCCLEQSCQVGRTWQRLNVAIRKSLSDISLAQLAGLDLRSTAQPFEREFKQFTRAKVTPKGLE